MDGGRPNGLERRAFDLLAGPFPLEPSKFLRRQQTARKPVAESIRRGIVWRNLAPHGTLGEITNQGGLRHMPEGGRGQPIRAAVVRQVLAMHEKRPRLANEVNLSCVVRKHSCDDVGLLAEQLELRGRIAVEKSAQDPLDRAPRGLAAIDPVARLLRDDRRWHTASLMS